MILERQIGTRRLSISKPHGKYTLRLKTEYNTEKIMVFYSREQMTTLYEMIQQALEEKRPVPDLIDDVILDTVAYICGITHEELLRRDRHTFSLWPRHLYRYFSVESGILPYTLGKTLSTSHVTIQNSVRVIKDMIDTKYPEEYYRHYLKIKELLNL